MILAILTTPVKVLAVRSPQVIIRSLMLSSNPFAQTKLAGARLQLYPVPRTCGRPDMQPLFVNSNLQKTSFHISHWQTCFEDISLFLSLSLSLFLFPALSLYIDM